MVPISQRANDLIVACEVSSKAYYDKHLVRPEWPGGYSGVTWGIGYDGGQASAAKIKADWGDRLPSAMVDAMLECVGVTGSRAKALLSSVRNRIYVSWDKAIDVYEHVDIPQWEERVAKACPGAEKLNGDCLGALTSLGYNRGAGGFNSSSDRFREMHAIRGLIARGELDKVPGEFRSMARLWPNLKGLRIRRAKEAELWEAGLKSNGGYALAAAAAAVPLPRPKPNIAPAPIAPPATPGAPEGGAGVVTAAATAKAAQQAHEWGLPPWEIAGIVVGGFVIAAGAIAAIHAHRSQPVLARAKG